MSDCRICHVTASTTRWCRTTASRPVPPGWGRARPVASSRPTRGPCGRRRPATPARSRSVYPSDPGTSSSASSRRVRVAATSTTPGSAIVNARPVGSNVDRSASWWSTTTPIVRVIASAVASAGTVKTIGITKPADVAAAVEHLLDHRGEGARPDRSPTATIVVPPTTARRARAAIVRCSMTSRAVKDSPAARARVTSCMAPMLSPPTSKKERRGRPRCRGAHRRSARASPPTPSPGHGVRRGSTSGAGSSVRAICPTAARELVQHDDDVGDHVRRQRPTGELTQRRGVDLATEVAGHVRDQLLAPGDLADHHGRLPDAVVAGDDGLDLLELDAQAAELDLEVDATDVVERSVGQSSDEIAGAETSAHPTAQHAGHEAFRGEVGAVEVNPGELVPGQIELADSTDHARTEPAVEHPAAGVPHGRPMGTTRTGASDRRVPGRGRWSRGHRSSRGPCRRRRGRPRRSRRRSPRSGRTG